jgi:hypothetical protein
MSNETTKLVQLAAEKLGFDPSMTRPRKLIAAYIAWEALTMTANAKSHSAFRPGSWARDIRAEAKRLARRTIAYLEKQGYSPEALYATPDSLDAISAVVIALGAQPNDVLEPPKYLADDETVPLVYRVTTLPWKWTTLITINLILKAVLTVRADHRTVVANWGSDSIDWSRETADELEQITTAELAQMGPVR